MKINILLFTKSLVRYGAEEHVLTLVRELPRSIFRVHMLCPTELAEKIQAEVPHDVEFFHLRLIPSTRLRDVVEFGKIIRQREIHILHSHLSSSSRFASPIGWACGVPVTMETTHVAENWRRGWLKSSYLPDRLFGRFVNFFIAVSNANATYLIQKKGLPPEKIAVIRNGSDLKRFNVPPGARQAMRQRLGLADDVPVLLVPARLESQKGHSVLLDAIRIVQREFPRVQVLCVGEGSLRKSLESRMVVLGLQETVRLLGFQPNIAEWFAAGDLTVLPSLYEGLPLVAIESLATLRPVVATAVDGTPEVVVDGLTGRTVPPGQAIPLAEAICSLLGDPALLRKMGQEGRKLVERDFNQDRQIQETTRLYLRAYEQACRSSGMSKGLDDLIKHEKKAATE